MDIDLLHRKVTELLAFKTFVEDLISRAGDNAHHANEVVGELTALKQMVDAELPQIQKAVNDAERAAVDIAQLQKDVAPIIEWVTAKQKEEAAAAASTETNDAAPRGEDGSPDVPAS